jgi:hypothetical protein
MPCTTDDQVIPPEQKAEISPDKLGWICEAVAGFAPGTSSSVAVPPLAINILVGKKIAGNQA